MRQQTDFLYEVTLQEQVTVDVNPSVNLGNQFEADLDAHEMGTPADGVYRFIVTRPVGKTHFLIISFRFIGAPAGSQYQIIINGNGPNNAGPFTVIVASNDPDPDKTFRFKVV